MKVICKNPNNCLGFQQKGTIDSCPHRIEHELNNNPKEGCITHEIPGIPCFCTPAPIRKQKLEKLKTHDTK